MRYPLVVAALSLAAVPLPAQTPAAVTAAAATITAADLTSHIGVIAHDSMLGRDTPSRGLALTAQYVIDQWQRLGLTRGGYDSTWIQRYRLPPRLDPAQSSLSFLAGATKATARFGNAARLVTLGGQGQPSKTTVVLLTGRPRATTLDSLNLTGRIVLYVVPAASSAADQRTVLDRLRCAGLVVLGPSASTNQPDRRLGVPARGRRGGAPWVIDVRPDAVDGLKAVLAAGGVDLARARADPAPAVREMPSLQIELDLLFEAKRDTVANVVAILPGSDPTLSKEYVVFSAHMDHHGILRDTTDSIANGADDNASGVAGLLALAKAFSQPEARPRRSLIFLATSGGAKDFSGAAAFVGSLRPSDSGLLFFSIPDLKYLPIQETAVVLNINLDMIGSRGGDSVVIDGLRDVELGVSPAWLTRAHPDLRLMVLDGGTVFRPRSDHFAFSRQVIPSLHIHTGTHDDHVATADVPAAIDADQAARILRLVFYLGQHVANEERQPRFSTEGRQQYVRLVEP